MPLDVLIPPRWDAITLARTTEISQTTTDAIVLHVFCDASSKHFPRPSAGIGIVVNMWHPREDMRRRTTKACFVPFSYSDHNDLVEAFALAEGAYVAIDQILSLMSRQLVRSIDKFELRFWSDSKVVLRALQNSTRFRAHNETMQHVLDIIKLKARELEYMRPDVSVQFRWCPEECVEPHQTADELSKSVRVSGGNTASKARALFQRLPHRAIKSALRERQNLLSDPAMRTITDDPATMKILQQVAGSPGFFGIVSGMLECLPSNSRRGMQDAIREQEDANKKLQYEKPASSTPTRYLKLFALIEVAASKLPADEQELVIAAIGMQKEANAHRVHGQAAGGVYEAAANGEIDVDQEPVVHEDPKVAEQPEALDEPEVLDEPDVLNDTMNADLPQIHDGLNTFEEAKDSKDSMSPAQIQIHDEFRAFEDAKVHETKVPEDDEILDELIGPAEPTQRAQATIIEAPKVSEELGPIEEPEAFQEPEIVVEARPNRIRSAWNWFGRRFQHL